MDLFLPKSDIVEKIENLTSETLLREDTDGFERLCDYINFAEDGPKEALKGIKKRLRHKNPKVVLFSLKLLELCVNHCGEPFHLKLASKDFLPDYVKILKTPNQNEDVTERMLDLLQIWAVGLAYDSVNAPLIQAQSELMEEGMEFPYRELDSFAPISRTPRRNPNISAGLQTSSAANHPIFDPRGAPGVVFAPPPSRSQGQGPPPQIFVHGNSFPGQIIQPAPQHRQPQQPSLPTPQKMREDLNSMKACVELFGETLTFVDPKTENVTQNELIQECHAHCKQWQNRLNEYLQLCEDETLLINLLAINDELNARFDHYSECAAKYLESNPLAQLGPTLPPRPANNPSPQPQQNQPPSHQPHPGQYSYIAPEPAQAPLISFDDNDVIQPTVASPNPLLDPSFFPSSTLSSTNYPNPYPYSSPHAFSPAVLATSAATAAAAPMASSPISSSPSSAPTSSPSRSSAAASSSQDPPPPQTEERLHIREILGVDPDDFSEDQLTQDLASLGFTKEQLLELRGQNVDQDSDQESVHSSDDEHRLMDARMKK